MMFIYKTELTTMLLNVKIRKTETWKYSFFVDSSGSHAQKKKTSIFLFYTLTRFAIHEKKYTWCL